MPKSKGFTLIELLTTITIIGILATIAMLNYQNIFKGGRDAKRQSDLKQIQSALYLYYTDWGFYPSCNPPSVVSGGCFDLREDDTLTSSTGNPNCWPPIPQPNPQCPSPERVYLNNVPHGPLGGGASAHYCYEGLASAAGGACDNTTTTTRCNFYQIVATLETSPGTLWPCDDGTGPHDGNFRITPL